MTEQEADAEAQRDAERGLGGEEEHEASSAVVSDQVRLKPYLSAVVQPDRFSATDQHSAGPLQHELELETVQGFSGHACISNVMALASGEILYTSSSVAVVHDLKEDRQYMFQQHSAHVSCLALHNDKQTVATGDVGAQGGRGTVYVWNTDTLEVLAELPPRALFTSAKENSATRGAALPCGPVTAVSFSKDGTKLVVADADMNMALYDWRKKGSNALLSIVKADKDDHTVLAIGSNPHDDANEETFVSCGVDHVKFWSAKGGQLKGQGWFGDSKGKGRLQPMLCLGFVTRGVTLVGTQDGSFYVFKSTAIGANLVRIVSDAHRGSVLCMYASDQHLVTGGQDGLVSRWRMEVKAGQLDLTYLSSTQADLLIAKQRNILQKEASESTVKPGIAEKEARDYHVCVKSLCYRDVGVGTNTPARAASKLLVGTSYNSLFEVDDVSKDASVLVEGHAYGRITGVSVHPALDDVFATCGEDATVRLWRASQTRSMATSQVPSPATCLNFAPDGASLAVGTLRSGVMILDSLKLKLRDSQPTKRRKGAAKQVRYAPSGHVLVVGSELGHIDVYDVMDGYRHLHVLRGHTGAVCKFDFDIQGKYLRSSSDALELMYWDVDRKVQIKTITQVRNALWQSSQCPLAWYALGALDAAGGPRNVTSTDSGNATKGLLQSQDYVQPKILAVGHAWGEVRLYMYPCVKKSAPYQSYAAHTHNVSGLVLMKGDTALVSVGGADLCIKVWRVISSILPPGDVMMQN
jgi:WD40 repeat protein